MRVIAGKHKGRKIHSIESKDFRPTTGKVREAIFSILGSGYYAKNESSAIEGATIIDLFCGSGSLTIEAFSRGAKQAIIIDIDSKHLEIAANNIRLIGEGNNLTILRADATMLPKARIKCDIAFIDPPYNRNLVAPTLKSLKEQGWLNDDAIIIVELSYKEDIEMPEGYTLIDKRIYGKSKLLFLNLE
jgi:16S rRNA (guanine966-N2)-methyltransferase